MAGFYPGIYYRTPQEWFGLYPQEPVSKKSVPVTFITPGKIIEGCLRHHYSSSVVIQGNVLFQPLDPGRIYGVKNGKNYMPEI
jgi:hypothetical protein